MSRVEVSPDPHSTSCLVGSKFYVSKNFINNSFTPARYFTNCIKSPNFIFKKSCSFDEKNLLKTINH
jgi:hypothetical protein